VWDTESWKEIIKLQVEHGYLFRVSH
jgi:hypothetical protein